VLGCPDFDNTFVLQTDPTDMALGAVLSQDFKGQEKVIAYASLHGRQLHDNREAVSDAMLLGRLSVRSGYRSPSPQVVEPYRKPLWSDSKMGVTTVTDEVN